MSCPYNLAESSAHFSKSEGSKGMKIKRTDYSMWLKSDKAMTPPSRLQFHKGSEIYAHIVALAGL